MAAGTAMRRLKDVTMVSIETDILYADWEKR